MTDASHLDDASTAPIGIPAVETATAQLPLVPAAAPGETRASRRRRRRRWPLVSAGVAVALLATGGVLAANAHKTVTLDVDGELTEIGTFAGSIERLLERKEIVLADHDVVTPALDAPLRDGAEVVVRLGREVTFQVDGEDSTEWVAALDASDVLRALTERGSDVRLVASRTGDRVEVPIRLDGMGGEVAVVADGRTLVVEYPGGDAGDVLDAAGLELGDLDLVSVVDVAEVDDAGAARVALVVQRVLTFDEPHEEVLPYERREVRDANRFRDLRPQVRQAGVEGLRTRVYAVTTIDGVEVERALVSEETVDPVDHVVAIGTRERPRPAPAPRASSGGGGGGGNIPESTWVALAQCESGGRPSVVSPGGRFHGLYQFSVATWRSVGGTGLPSNASPAEQRYRAERLQARSGWGQWPACSRRLGLRN